MTPSNLAPLKQVSQAAYIYVTCYIKLGQTMMFRYCQHHCHALVDWL
eukprot:COSAG02_NODE_47265_length_342_cov_1.049383_1_plen_46_part_01